jgi:uncharacterized membrane protein YfhO
VSPLHGLLILFMSNLSFLPKLHIFKIGMKNGTHRMYIHPLHVKNILRIFRDPKIQILEGYNISGSLDLIRNTYFCYASRAKSEHIGCCCIIK